MLIKGFLYLILADLVMRYQAAIIHISDTEFGLKNRAEQEDFRKLYDNAYKAIMDDFISDIQKVVLQEHNVKPSEVGLVISGDITDGGRDEEFRKAEKNIIYVLEKLKVPREQLAIVPGNHDVNWDHCKKAYDAECSKSNQDKNTIKEQMRHSPEKLAEFSQFFRTVCNKDFKIQTPITFETFQKLGVVLIGLDSTYPSLWSDEDNYGVIQVEQVRSARAELENWRKINEKLISVAVMHHSLLPELANGKDTSFLHKAGEVRKWLRESQGFNIALCGHEHAPKRSASVGEDFNILVTGSFGLSLEELRKTEGLRPETNKYQIILVASNGQVKFLFRRLNREDAPYPQGKWEEDKADGPPSIEIKLRRQRPPQPKKVDIEVGNPVECSGTKNGKRWTVGVKINAPKASRDQIKLVKYRIEPGGEEVDGDPCCSFLAIASLKELEGRRVKAWITFENGEKVEKEANIPPVYVPTNYNLAADY